MELRLSRTEDIPKPNYYIQALRGEFSSWAFDEKKALTFKGQWRSQVFEKSNDYPLDLEIGTGNGYFFAHRCQTEPNRGLVGIEIKFKPLIQSIRRCLKQQSQNGRMVRFNASLVDWLFAEGELNNVFIHHPDPWEKEKKHKHRLIQDEYLRRMFHLQKSGSWLEFKTDSRDYFEWFLQKVNRSSYQLSDRTYDLHHSSLADQNFITYFERIFLQQGLPICYALIYRP